MTKNASPWLQVYARHVGIVMLSVGLAFVATLGHSQDTTSRPTPTATPLSASAYSGISKTIPIGFQLGRYSASGIRDLKSPVIGLVSENPLVLDGLEKVLGERYIRPQAYGKDFLAIENPATVPHADVYVVDASRVSPWMSKFAELVRRRSSTSRIVAAAYSMEPSQALELLRAGFDGIVEDAENQTASDLLPKAIDHVMRGEYWMSRGLFNQLATKVPASVKGDGSDPRFTDREKEVLAQLAAGRSNREIGRPLGIEERTVKAHVARAFRKTGVKNRIALAGWYAQSGLAENRAAVPYIPPITLGNFSVPKDSKSDPSVIGLVSDRPLATEGLIATLGEKFLPIEGITKKTLPAALYLVEGYSTPPWLERLPSILREASPGARVVLLSSRLARERAAKLITAGFSGLIEDTGDIDLQEFLPRAVSTILQGEFWISRKLASQCVAVLLKRWQEAAPKKVPLTDREKEVLALLVDGKSNKEIGHPLGIEERTVKAHVAKLMRKIGVTNRIVLARAALEGAFGQDYSNTEHVYPQEVPQTSNALEIPTPNGGAANEENFEGPIPPVQGVRPRVEEIQTTARRPSGSARQARKGFFRLAPDEDRLAGYIKMGMTNAQMAAKFGISKSALQARVTKLYRKLGPRRRLQLVLAGQQNLKHRD